MESLHMFTVLALRHSGQPNPGFRCSLPHGKTWEVRHGAIRYVCTQYPMGGAAWIANVREFLRLAPHGSLLRLFAGFSGASGYSGRPVGRQILVSPRCNGLRCRAASFRRLRRRDRRELSAPPRSDHLVAVSAIRDAANPAITCWCSRATLRSSG